MAPLYECPCQCGHAYDAHHVFTNRSRTRAFNCILRHIKLRHGCKHCTCRNFDRNPDRLQQWYASHPDNM